MTEGTQPRFRLRTIAFSELSAHAGLLAEVERGALDGVVIRGIFSADAMRAVRARIIRHDPPFYIFPPIEPQDAIFQTSSPRHP